MLNEDENDFKKNKPKQQNLVTTKKSLKCFQFFNH